MKNHSWEPCWPQMLPKTILDRFWGPFLNDLEAFWGGFWDQSGVHFEMIFATVIRLDENIKDKKDLGKIILCDLQNEIYPEIEKTFLNVLHGSGYPELNFQKKVDFEELYKKNQN